MNSMEGLQEIKAADGGGWGARRDGEEENDSNCCWNATVIKIVWGTGKLVKETATDGWLWLVYFDKSNFALCHRKKTEALLPQSIKWSRTDKLNDLI